MEAYLDALEPDAREALIDAALVGVVAKQAREYRRKPNTAGPFAETAYRVSLTRHVRTLPDAPAVLAG